MEIDPTLTTVLEDGTQLVVVYDGPRGLPGRDADPGQPGPPGRSIRVLGDWNDASTYRSGDAVTAYGSAAPGVYSLWIARDGYTPTRGVPPRQEPEKWVEVGTSSEVFGPTWHVLQLLHPFTRVGQVATFSATTGRYELADTRNHGMLGLAVVREVVDSGHVVLQAAGEVPGIDPAVIHGAGAWEPGRLYFLSTVPGQLQTLDPGLEGYASQPVLVPTGSGAAGQTGLLLGWGPEGRLPPTTVADVSPPSKGEGDLWYRTDAWPGLYVRVLDATGTTEMWVQVNG